MKISKDKKADPEQNKPEMQKKQKKMSSRQIAALAGVVLLAAMYIVTLITAFTDTDSSGRMFALSLFATIAIPLLIWIYTWMYGKLTNKHTFADLNILQDSRDYDSRNHDSRNHDSRNHEKNSDVQ